MSGYRNFNRCVICRSAKNLKDYQGDFEVTMLLNTLYMAVIHPIEERRNLHIKPGSLAKWLRENKVVNEHGNKFSSDDFVRYLRNGLAHFNIHVEDKAQDGRRVIDNIKIIAKNQPAKTICKNSCKEPKCKPKQYLEEDGSICSFTFTTIQLRDFTNCVITLALETLTDEICVECPYKREENYVSFNL